MSHLDPELAALIALGEDAGDREHLAGCAQCRAQVDQLAAVVTIARDEGALSLAQPPPELWDRIAAAVGLEAGGLDGTQLAAAGAGQLAAGPADRAAADRGASGPERTGRDGRAARNGPGPAGGPGRAGRSAPWWPRRPLAAGLAGALAGLVIGIGGAAGIHQLTRPAPATVVATIPLRPLAQFPQWQGASGTAVMASGPAGRHITVSLTAPRRPGFYEVWLLARNGVSMISLGDLDASHAGRFDMPPGVDLANYSRIDISLQPFDGSTLHAKTSVVRGSLP
jgi:Anti-sigma-K factor rskA